MHDNPPLLRRLHDAAAAQDGCISVAQLDAAGIPHDSVLSLVRRGALARVVHGVYVVGSQTLTDRQAIWAGLLAAGPGSVASHFTAAALHGLMEPTPDDVWVTTPSRRHGRIIKTLLPVASTGHPATINIVSADARVEAALLSGLPVRHPAGTIVEVAGRPPGRCSRARRARTVQPSVVVRAWSEADYRNLLRVEAIERELGRGIAGSALIRQLLKNHPIVSDDQTDVATSSEFALLAAVLRLGLPRPLTNQPLRLPGATYFPDQFYSDAGLVAEADGGVHRRPTRRAADLARDAHMRANGLAVLRFPNEAIEADADACAAEIAVVRAARLRER